MTLSLAEAIARVPAWVGKETRATPLSGGITNQNYRMEVEGESFVLRISGDATDLLGVNRAAEHIASRAASQLGIAPEVVYIIQPEGYLVTRYITCCQLPPEEIVKPANIRRIAEAFKQFHQLSLSLPTTFSPFRRVEHLTQVSRDHGAIFPKNFDWLIERMHEVEVAFQRDPFIPRPCHNDLLNANFFDDGRILIIDWEYAGMGDIYFDLANFASHHRLDDEQARFLLECYFGNVTPRRFARLQLMRPMSEMHEALWGTTQTCLSKLDFDFREYAELWFARATQAMQDPRWGNWLKEIIHA
jgi:thiamine kinase-like enzyme